MTEMEIREIADAVIRELPKRRLVEVEVSARHVHLTQADVEKLFGPGATLTPIRSLSQPGQFLAEERVTLVGRKLKKERIAILGPVRPETQVELSKSDCMTLGVDAPLRESGDVTQSGGIEIVGPRGAVQILQGAIVAHSHIHLTPEAARDMGVSDRDHVKVEVCSGRPLIFQDVIVRVSSQYANRMHIDADEANAAGISSTAFGTLLGQ